MHRLEDQWINRLIGIPRFIPRSIWLSDAFLFSLEGFGVGTL